MNPLDPGTVAGVFDLGMPVGPLRPVTGGWSNRMWRLDTNRGSFAVKEFNRFWDSPVWLPWLEQAWEVERTAWSIGIRLPVPVPNPATGGCLAEVPVPGAAHPATVRVHHWVDAVPLGPGPVPPPVAAWVGSTLARIHGLGIQPRDRSVLPTANSDEVAGWPELVGKAHAQGSPFAAALHGLTPTLQGIAALTQAAVAEGGAEVMSHTDVDQKNLLLRAGGPLLCDWDVCSAIVPRRELAEVALSMAGWTVGPPDPMVLRTVVEAYRGAGGHYTRPAAVDLGVSLGVSVDWLAFNVRRSLGERAQDHGDVELAGRLVPELVAALPRQLATAHDLPRLLA